MAPMKVMKATKKEKAMIPMKAKKPMKAMKPKKKPATKKPAARSTKQSPPTEEHTLQLIRLYSDEVLFNRQFGVDTPAFEEWLREM